jgi:hypothetical protein
VWLATAVVLGGATPASADACHATATWVVGIGSMSPGARCGDVVLTTDLASGDRSRVRVAIDHDRLREEIGVRWQALTGGGSTLEVQIGSIYVLVRDGELGVYFSEAQWGASGYSPVAGLDSLKPSRLGIVLDDRIVTVSIDDHPAGTWTLPTRIVGGEIAIGFVGPRERQVRALIGEVSVDTHPPACRSCRRSPATSMPARGPHRPSQARSGSLRSHRPR